MISNKDDFQHACGNQSLTWKENGKLRTSGLSLIYHVNYFRYSTDILHPAQLKLLLYLKKTGLASRNIVHHSACFYVLFLCEADYITIDSAGSYSAVACILWSFRFIVLNRTKKCPAP